MQIRGIFLRVLYAVFLRRGFEGVKLADSVGQYTSVLVYAARMSLLWLPVAITKTTALIRLRIR